MDEGRINRLGAFKLLLTALLLCRLLILGVDDESGDDAREVDDDGDVGSEYNSWNSAAMARGIMPIDAAAATTTNTNVSK